MSEVAQPAETAPAPAEAKANPTPTSYRVLAQDNDHAGQWLEVNSYEARSAKQAIEMAVKATGVAGVFIAVPERSFTPTKVELKPVTKLEFS